MYFISTVTGTDGSLADPARNPGHYPLPGTWMASYYKNLLEGDAWSIHGVGWGGWTVTVPGRSSHPMMDGNEYISAPDSLPLRWGSSEACSLLSHRGLE